MRRADAALRRVPQGLEDRHPRDPVRAAGTGLQVTSRLDLAVKVAFITAYRYEQTGEDEWRDDVLVRTRIQTNDDGKDYAGGGRGA